MDSRRSDVFLKTCPEAEQWKAFYFGWLPQNAVSLLAAHLAQCPTCVATLQGLEGQTDELVQALRSLPAPVRNGRTEEAYYIVMPPNSHHSGRWVTAVSKNTLSYLPDCEWRVLIRVP